MTLRKFLLWLIGADVLKKPRSKYDTTSFSISLPKANFRLRIGPDMCVYLPRAPNALHRALQRLVLGFKWTMLDGDN